MPHAEIKTKQCLLTLKQLHGEIAGKLQANAREAKRLRTCMLQVEAVMKMLDPEVNLRAISVKRRVRGNPWFKRGTLYRSAVDVMRRAGRPMTAREITDALMAGKTPEPTRKQAIIVQAAIMAALRKRDGESVAGEGMPPRWTLRDRNNT